MIVLPRNDYPRPQMRRDGWQNLNGEWEFEFDFGKSGEERKLWLAESFSRRITVPFCPESPLSGIGYRDFIPAVWYRRTFTPALPVEGRTLLHFGAVDYACKVWLNGTLCGEHRGGYSSFTLDITDALCVGENLLVVYAEDDTRSGRQPIGKQCPRYASALCSYTRTTGIWQTVWAERVPYRYIGSYHVIPNVPDARLSLTVTPGGRYCDQVPGYRARCTAFYQGRQVGTASAAVTGGVAQTELSLSESHLWEPGNPALYDLTIELLAPDGSVEDSVAGYCGLRSAELSDGAFLLNGKKLFLRTVLDQGYNPDGVYTAPNDDFLRRDIELSMALGFNGARLHQRVFEERTLYWADKLGYLVFGEYANGSDMANGDGLEHFLPEWMENVDRDFNHPSLIGWCPFNESYWSGTIDSKIQWITYQVTKAMDSTRPVIDSSGGMHYVTDIFDVHDYTADPAQMEKNYAPMTVDPTAFYNPPNTPILRTMRYAGQPYFVSEYGGIYWDASGTGEGWGYGNPPKSAEEAVARYEGLTRILLACPRVCGFCYTQLTDVEQERNGLYNYDRTPKFTPELYARVRAATLAPAAMESALRDTVMSE